MTNEEFEDKIKEIKRDHPIQLLTSHDNDIHLSDGWIIEPDVSFKKLNEITFIQFALVFGMGSKLLSPNGIKVELTKRQQLFLQSTLDTVCYNDERHEI